MFINKRILFTQHYIPDMDSSIDILHSFLNIFTTTIAFVRNSTHMTIRQVIKFLNKAYQCQNLYCCFVIVFVSCQFFLFIFVTFQPCLQL